MQVHIFWPQLAATCYVPVSKVEVTQIFLMMPTTGMDRPWSIISWTIPHNLPQILLCLLCVLNSQHLYYVATDSSHATTQLRITEKFLTNINDVFSKITKAALFSPESDSSVTIRRFLALLILKDIFWEEIELKLKLHHLYMQLCFSLVCIIRNRTKFYF